MGHRWKRLRRVSVTNAGDQYTEKPTVTITPPAAPKQEAQGTAALVGGTVNSVTLDSGGNFYSTPPAVTISAPDVPGGTQATGIAAISNGEVTGVTITDPGTGYSTPPTVTIAKSTDPKEDFAATATLEFDSATGTVTKIKVNDSGNFYDSDNPPVVTISPPFAETNFERGEDVTIQADANGAVVSGEVANFIESSQTLSLIHTANDDGTFIAPSTGLTITGENSGATRKITKVILPEIPGDVSDEFNDETQDFLDFSESNPFGEPEVASIIQQKADSDTAAAVPATQIKITGSITDPSFTPNKTYKVIANDSSSQFVADDNDANFIEGVRDLNVTSLTIGTNATDNIEITYTPQDDSDTLTLAGDGFTHIGVPEGNYQLNTGDASSPTVGALQPGDSAAPRVGDSVDAGFMSDTAYALQVAGASTSMVWDSAAIDFGTGVGGLSFIRNFPVTTTDVPGLSDPSGVVFGKNGRRLYFVNKNYADSSAIVYGAKLETPYDISSISDGDEERADLSTVFARSFYLNTDSDQFYGGQRLSAIAFNPQGTKMYAVEADRDILNQFNLSDSWDISTATYEKGLVGSVPFGYTAAQSNVTVNSNVNLNNTFSMEWYDSGRKMAVGKLGVNGPVDELAFSTPYDISTFTSRTFHTNNIVDSYGTTNKFVQKLAFTKGSMFNKDGTKRYYIHRQFSDSDYDSSSSGTGNGLNGNRMILLRTDLSTPYDLSTMTYHSQIELTNLPDSGAPTTMNINDAFAMHPDGSKIFVMTNSVPDMPTDSGWTGTNQFNIIEFGANADSNGSSFINLPDISVKPMVQADSATAWAEAYLDDSNLTAFRQLIPVGSAHYVDPIIDSEGSFFRSSAVRLISTVDSGSRYETPGIGNAFYLAIDEGFQADSSSLTDSNYIVSIDSDTLYGGGYGLVFGIQSIDLTAVGQGDRAIMGGGGGGVGAPTNEIYYYDITTSGNGNDFGDLTGARLINMQAASNGTRGVFIGGYNSAYTNPYNGNFIDYITIAIPGNAIDFGDYTSQAGNQGVQWAATVSNNTRAVTSGGRYNAYYADLTVAGTNATMYTKEMNYITIATTGNSTYFGEIDITLGRADGASRSNHCGWGNTTRGLWFGGIYRNATFTGGNQYPTTIDYITIDTLGNSQDFGEMTSQASNGSACGNNTRALHHKGNGSTAPTTEIDYVTIDTTGNATDFGDLGVSRSSTGAASNTTHATFTGGINISYSSGYRVRNEIEIVSIDTPGNSTDHGDIRDFIGSGTNLNTAYLAGLSGNAA